MNYIVQVERWEIGETTDRHSSYRYLLRWRGEFESAHETLSDALRALADKLEEE